MATIRKQSIYSSLFIYAGFAIGALNVLFLFPKFFTPEQFGLTRVLMDIALIFSTICAAGTLPVAMKFYPFYKHHLPKQQNDLLTWVFVIGAIMCLFIYLAFPLIEPWALKKFGYRSPILVTHFKWVYPLAISLVAISMLEVFAWIIGRTVIANFLKEFLFRILTLLLIGIWAIGSLTDFNVFIGAYASLYFIPVAILIWVVYSSGEFSINFSPSKVTHRYKGIMLKFGGAYFLSAVLNIVAKTNDTLIIASQSQGGLADAAIFTIATYLITVMDVPQRSMVSAATPQIALAWKNNDLDKLDRLYKKTALNLLVIAAGIMGIVVMVIPYLQTLLGDAYSGLSILMIVLGLGKLIDLGTGLNSQILQLSKHWKIDLFTNMFFVLISIVFNYLLTKNYGIVGTAFGSLFAIILYNLIRFVYIKKIYGLQPFSLKNLLALSLAILFATSIYFIPVHLPILISSLIKIVAFGFCYGFAIIRFNVSHDITELWFIISKRIRSFLS
jgi:O-antigen/teichoic acid export membrane protein